MDGLLYQLCVGMVTIILRDYPSVDGDRKQGFVATKNRATLKLTSHTIINTPTRTQLLMKE